MERIENPTGKEVWLHHYDETAFTIPFQNEFVCLIWNDGENKLSQDVMQRLLEAGCRYFLFGGNRTDEQEMDVDKLHVGRVARDSNTPHVMTTAHQEKSLQRVMDFALEQTDFDGHVFEHCLLLYIAKGA